MKMIAITTIHGHKLIKKADPDNHRSKDKYQDLIAKPGDEFDTEEYGIDEAEAQSLIDRKAAKRKTREVPDDREPGVGVRQPVNPAPRPAAAVQLDTLTDDELRQQAVVRNVTIKAGAPRAEIIAALNKAPKA